MREGPLLPALLLGLQFLGLGIPGRPAVVRTNFDCQICSQEDSASWAIAQLAKTWQPAIKTKYRERGTLFYWDAGGRRAAVQAIACGPISANPFAATGSRRTQKNREKIAHPPSLLYPKLHPSVRLGKMIKIDVARLGNGKMIICAGNNNPAIRMGERGDSTGRIGPVKNRKREMTLSEIAQRTKSPWAK